MQMAKFAAARQALADRGVMFRLGHIAVSLGVLRYPEAHLDMGRFGLVLYGYASSDEEVESPAELKPVMTLKARIAGAMRSNPAFISSVISTPKLINIPLSSELAGLIPKSSNP